MEEKREYIYDFVRILACMFIIGIHSANRILHGNNYDIIWYEYNITNAIVRMGVLLFTFISGALILNKKEEKSSAFYKKRFVKIVIPLFIYSYIYLWANKYNYSSEILLPSNLISSFFEIISQPVHYHFWFIYMIVGIYIFVPYLRKMLQNLNNVECRNLFILLYIISFAKYFLPLFNITIGITNLLIIDWIVPFVLGYLLTRESINSHYKLIYAFGIVSFVFLIIATRFLDDMKSLYDLAPTMLIQTQAFLLFFIRNKEVICKNKILNECAKFVSGYCYEIYLIHALVLELILKTVFLNRCFITPFISMICCIILAFVISLFIVIIINTCITKLGKILTKIWKNIKSRKM